MKNSLKLLPAGLIPFALGYAFNYLILRFPLFVRFIFPLSLLCTVLWGRLSYTLSNPRESPFPQALSMCSPGLFVLALLLFQALVLKRYWMNAIGSWSQLYFLPFLNISSSLLSPPLSALWGTASLSALYAGSWLAMFSSCLTGILLKRGHTGLLRFR